MGKLKYPVINGEKQCGLCREWLTISCFSKTKKHYSSKCRDCISKYAKEYRRRPEAKKIVVKTRKKYFLDPKNREKVNARGRRYNQTQQYKDRRNRNRREWSMEQKKKAIKYKGGKCAVCGYSRCSAAMDFHHKNPSEKEGYGTGALKSHWSFKKNIPELDKCVLLCVRCHREIHAGKATL